MGGQNLGLSFRYNNNSLSAVNYDSGARDNLAGGEGV